MAGKKHQSNDFEVLLNDAEYSWPESGSIHPNAVIGRGHSKQYYELLVKLGPKKAAFTESKTEPFPKHATLMSPGCK